MGEDLRAKDEAALAEFKASLQDGVENARAAMPALAKSVSTMALLLKYDAALALASGWYAEGIVFDPGTKLLTELQRVECVDTIFSTKEEAEAHALMLCKSWIDQHLERQ
jgi:hypothetical protein